MALIEVSGLSRTFRVRGRRDVEAVKELYFTIEAGEMVGYIGPNGAGKSTTIKMLTGILVPTSGSIRVAGVDPSRRRTQLARRIGVVFGQRTTLWWDLPLRDSFDLLQKVYKTDPARHRANLAEFVELPVLGSVASRLRLAVQARRRSASVEMLATAGHRLTSRLDPQSLFDEAARLLPALVDGEEGGVVTVRDGVASVCAATRSTIPTITSRSRSAPTQSSASRTRWRP